MNVVPMTTEAVRYVAENMRPWDRREIFATRIGDSTDSFVADVMETGPVSWVAGTDRPIAVYGAAPLWRGVWAVWFFATDEIGEIGLAVTRMIRNAIIPKLFETGAHRLECRSMEGHEDAQRWLEVLGAHREATLKSYGRDGQDFHIYAWGR